MSVPSVVPSGLVQRMRTVSPERAVVRLVMGPGRLRDGGRGGVGLAQPVRRSARSGEKMRPSSGQRVRWPDGGGNGAKVFC